MQSQTVTRIAGNFDTTSTTFVDITGMSITMSTAAARCLICAIVGGFNSTSNSPCVDLAIDGVLQGQTFGLTVCSSAVESQNFSFTFLTAVLTAASHTFKLQARTPGGQFTVYASTTIPCVFSVIETSLTA